MIDKKNGFIFIHIIKTGGTSINKFFRPKGRQRHLRISYYKRRNKKAFNSLFKFTFVRNPWDKMVSQYFYIKRKKPKYRKSFEEFICDFDLCPEKANLRRKCVPIQYQPVQYPWITNENGDLMVDFVGRFENIEEDFNKVLKEINYKGNKKLSHLNRTKHEHYSNYYNEKTKKIVEKKFKKDIEMFSYEFEE